MMGPVWSDIMSYRYIIPHYVRVWTLGYDLRVQPVLISVVYIHSRQGPAERYDARVEVSEDREVAEIPQRLPPGSGTLTEQIVT